MLYKTILYLLKNGSTSLRKWIVINILRTFVSCKWFHLCKTRNKVIFGWPNWNLRNGKWRIEPIAAAKASNELPKVVKCESNFELACCRWNSFKWSVYAWLCWGYSSFDYWGLQKLLVVDKIRIPARNAHSGTIGGQLHGREGNNPDELVRSQIVH